MGGDEYQSYIIIKYVQNLDYLYGFFCDIDRESDIRSSIDKIKYKNQEYSINGELIIDAGTNIEIHFNKNITNLDFFLILIFVILVLLT